MENKMTVLEFNNVPNDPGFTLEFPDYQLRVPNVDSPLWNGPYKEGCLSIYRANVIGTAPNPESVYFIAVYHDHNTDSNFLLVYWFAQDVALTEIIEQLQEKVFARYCEMRAAIAIDVASTSSKGHTLH